MGGLVMVYVNGYMNGYMDESEKTFKASRPG